MATKALKSIAERVALRFTPRAPRQSGGRGLCRWTFLARVDSVNETRQWFLFCPDHLGLFLGKLERDTLSS